MLLQIARGLMVHPSHLFLLDEPFAGLDATLREELVVLLREWLLQWKIPVLSVSHDVGECFLLGAEVIRMAEGQVVGGRPGADQVQRRLAVGTVQGTPQGLAVDGDVLEVSGLAEGFDPTGRVGGRGEE